MAGSGVVESPYHQILMKDVEGERVKSGTVNAAKRYILGTETREPVMILRGELVIPIAPQERSDRKPPHNYCLQRDHNVTFYSVEDVSPLYHTDYMLLEAIESAGDRHAVFANVDKLDKLEWGNNLKQGDEAYVCLSSPHSNPGAAEWSRARILYKGSVKSLPGTMFGVEIMDGRYHGRGSTSGWFQEEYYFQCEDNCGLFVSLDKLAPQPPQASQSYADIARPRQDNLGSSVDPQDIPIALNNRVIVYNKQSLPICGTVRWIGDRTNIRNLGALHVGIETDTPVFIKNFVGSIPGMSHLFRAKNRHHLVVPLSMATREDSSTTAQLGTQSQTSNPNIRATHCKVDPHGATPQDDHIPNPTALARDLGMSKHQLMSEQERLLKEGEMTKLAEVKDENYNEVKSAMYGESITASDQQKILDDIKQQGGHGGNATPPQPRGTSDPSRQDSNQPLAKQHSWQDQGHIYKRIPGDSPNPKRRIAEHGKAASADLLQESRGQYSGTHQPQYPDHFQGNQQYPAGGQRQWEKHANLHGQHLQRDQTGSQQMQRVSSNPQLQGVAAVTVPPGVAMPLSVTLDLELGSTIQIQPLDPSQPPRYGVIKWIGFLPGVQKQEQIAGIELEEYMDGCTDGTWQQTGERYFECPNGKGMFYPLINLKKDERFCDPGSTPGVTERGNPLDDIPHWEEVDQTLEPHPQQMLKYIGERRGIQGHQNSCYLDATVFGLFALSDVFDSMFLAAHEVHKTADLNRKQIEDMLWKGIVNPLRKNGVVRYESVMALRSKLEELGKMEGIAQDEKDPEEFLNMLFKHMLRVEPFIEIKRPFGVEKEFFVQLFLEFDESMRLPTVGDLLRKMFTEQDISFTEMPSRLLIQVPRFGKQFKTFQKIVPDLKLRIADLTDTYQNAKIPNCFICGRRAVFKCTDCLQFFRVENAVSLCDSCDAEVHKHEERARHPQRATFFEGVSELDLLSVICIETSHYVCFAKDPHEEPDQPSNWIFFDSMANRLYDTYNVPRVADCTAELNEWIYPTNGDRTRLMSTPPKNLPEYVRRFTQDVYMCVYVHPDVSLYG